MNDKRQLSKCLKFTNIRSSLIKNYLLLNNMHTLFLFYHILNIISMFKLKFIKFKTLIQEYWIIYKILTSYK